MSGYLHPAYAASLSEFGEPFSLPRCGGWLLKRTIPNTSLADAMGCYPLFACEDWSQLRHDLEELSHDLVAIFLVTDPFGDFDEAYLRECFPDLVKPFKEHFIVDLSQQLDSFVHPHHLRNARNALRQLEVERCHNPIDALEDWLSLYDTLIERHSITGIAAFSRNSFAKQLAVPGIVAFRAAEHGETVGMLLWYQQNDRAYYHLGAYSTRGYETGSSFALFDHALRYFCSQEIKWLNLGAAAGSTGADSGLTRFKQGWSNGVRTAYFCGRICARKEYEQLVAATQTGSTDYFPAYRLGEFR